MGGDRFAPNLLALPHAFSYGRVSASAAEQIADAQERGNVALPWLRGRATFAPSAQAAQQLAHVRRDEVAFNALNPRSVEALGSARWRVRLAASPADVFVTVATAASGPAALLTCSATHPAHPPAYRLEEMVEAPNQVFVRAVPTGQDTPVPPIPQ